MRYSPNMPEPFPGDETPGLDGILKDVKHGCARGKRAREFARELTDWYEGESEKYIPFRPAEDALSWLTRPKRVSFITRKAVNKLTSHLYKPGPRLRKVTSDDRVDAWYTRVAQDLQLNSLMQKVDREVTLKGLCAVGVYTTGRPGRPVGYHLFPREDFEFYASPDDPRTPVAVCTVTRVDGDTKRFRLFTATHYYTFFEQKRWGVEASAQGANRFDPAASGEHGYGCLPFKIFTHELPTTCLEVPGLGKALSKVNKALNVDKSNLAHWVHHYGRPLGAAKGVPASWRPKFIEGGFLVLPATVDSTDDAAIMPELSYLESSLDIASIWEYIRGEANAALDELDIPLSCTVQSDGGGGSTARSGLGIAADEADLVTYSKGRQPLFEVQEKEFAGLVCRVASSAVGGLSDALAAAAADTQLRIVWPEPRIDLPGQAQDAADQWELDQGITDPIEVLMRRNGLTEAEAVEQYRAVQRRKALAGRIAVEELAAAATGATAAQAAGPAADDDTQGGVDADAPAAGEMGIPGGASPSGRAAPASAVVPNVTASVAVDPQFPIPAGPLILPATPGYGGWGTES